MIQQYYFKEKLDAGHDMSLKGWECYITLL